MSHHSDLIDTTEMYLRTVYELEEEGVTALRARIAERLGQSGPTVSQTVARMERDGLLRVAGDRHLVLTDKGRREAIAVMRKHRLAERLLVDVIGLDWEDVHVEACRWEHVMSDAVERRIVAMLAPPLVCPHGNPIPGLDQLGVADTGGGGPDREPLSDSVDSQDDESVTLLTLSDAASAGGEVVVARISEHVQSDTGLLRDLRSAGIAPGTCVSVSGADGAAVLRAVGGQLVVVPEHSGEHIFVRRA